MVLVEIPSVHPPFAVFCCIGALAITGSLHHVDKDLLGWWLCERQCIDGGLNGRPEKFADVGYIDSFYSCLVLYLNKTVTFPPFRYAIHGGCYLV